MLVAGVRARAQFDTGRPLTWVMLAGFVVVFVGAACLWWANEVRHRPVSAGVRLSSRASARRREDDSEAGDGQPKEDLSGRE